MVPKILFFLHPIDCLAYPLGQRKQGSPLTDKSDKRDIHFFHP